LYAYWSDKELYEKYCEDLNKPPPIRDEKWRLIFFRAQLRKFKFRRKKIGSHEDCHVCNDLRAEIAQNVPGASMQLQRHTLVVSQDRAYMISRRNFSATHPLLSLWIACDLSSSLLLPHTRPNVNPLGRRISMNIAGFVVAGVGRFLILSLSRPNIWKKGMNFVCTMLDFLVRHLIASGKCRGIFELWTDSGKENMNKAVRRLIALMIATGLFSAAFFSNLVPEHAKNEVDRGFLDWQNYADNHSIYTLEHFIQLVPTMYPNEATRPQVLVMDVVGNYDVWLEPVSRALPTGTAYLHSLSFVRTNAGFCVQTLVNAHFSLFSGRGWRFLQGLPQPKNLCTLARLRFFERHRCEPNSSPRRPAASSGATGDSHPVAARL
jgi:hypothetical protein